MELHWLPVQVVETHTGDPVYVVFKCEFSVEENRKVTDNITWLNMSIVKFGLVR